LAVRGSRRVIVLARRNWPRLRCGFSGGSMSQAAEDKLLLRFFYEICFQDAS
jgi:hypothetical protein